MYGHVGDKPAGRQMTGRQSNWATHFSQLGDNIGRELQDAYV